MGQNILKRLWDSPTFTTWGNLATQSFRLVLVTPLILNRFDETEIAAWNLFASLNFFGTTISTRLSLTFSRMLSFCMGGASDLGPMKHRIVPEEKNANPNWELFAQAYGTVGSVNHKIALLNLLIALAMGGIGLSNLLDEYDEPHRIIVAFAIMQVSSFVIFVFKRYGIALQGMDYVALLARWGIVFGVASCLAGAAVLWFGGGIVSLAVAMQSIMLLGVLRNWYLLRYVEEGKVASFPVSKMDRQVLKWAWEPTWKGFLSQLGIVGGIQVVSIMYTGVGEKSEIASFLFCMRIIEPVMQFGQAPLNAIQPRLSKLRATGNLSSLRESLAVRTILCLVIMMVAVLGLGIAFPYINRLIGSNISFLPFEIWSFYGTLFLVVRFVFLSSTIFAVGNDIKFYLEPIYAMVCSIGMMAVMQNSLGTLGPILCWGVPLIVALNVKPLRLSAAMLNEQLVSLRTLGFLGILCLYVSVSLLYLWLL